MKKIIRIARLGKSYSPETKAYFEKHFPPSEGIQVECINYTDLYYDYDGTFKFIETDEKLPEFDAYRPLGTNDFRTGLNYYFSYLLKKKVIDKRNKYRRDISKFSEVLCFKHYNIPIPKTVGFLVSKRHYEDYPGLLERKFTYPFIGKEVNKSQGKGILYIQNRQELLEHLRRNEGQCIIFQEFIPNDGDVRMLVFGGKYFGAYKRYNPNDYRNNISQGGYGIPYHPSRKLQRLGEKVATCYMVDVAGVDILLGKDGKYYVLEVNTFPQFKGFEKTTGHTFAQGFREFIKRTYTLA